MTTQTIGTLLSSAVRTATTTTAEVDASTAEARGVMLFLNVTADPAAAETLSTQIEVKDLTSGTFAPLTTFGTLGDATTPAIQLYTLYPGGIETAATTLHEVQGLPLPSYFRVKITHSASGNWTYSLGYQFLS